MIQIPLIKSSQILGVQFYTGTMNTRDLIDHSEAPLYEPGTNISKGYQRAPKDQRVYAIRDRVLSDPDSMDSFITSITLNIRVPEAVSYIKSNKNGHATFEFIDNLGPFYLVDGQTRMLGIKLARSEAFSKRLSKVVDAIDNSRISITLSFTDDVFKEAYFFYLINQYAKSIPPEGAMRMIYDGFMNNETQFINEITSPSTRVSADDIIAMSVAEMLYNHSTIWAGRIRDFNESGVGKMSIRAVAMKMVKPLVIKISNQLKAAGGKQFSPEKICFDIIEAYWVAISRIFPEMFHSSTERDYGITKSSQSEVMTKVLRYIYDAKDSYWASQKVTFGDPKDPKVWEKLLKKPLTNFSDQNGDGQKVVGKVCWFVGSSGSMGQYTNSAAKRQIAQRLVEAIEKNIGITKTRVI